MRIEQVCPASLPRRQRNDKTLARLVVRFELMRIFNETLRETI
ncbi:hypothetical protein [Methylomonas rivi]|uniref:Transposase n=1 Tax=Methylomonas rivi TaxID=2952226 RepID=A0ABT1U2Q7_9GAMM|nr:hypothetical protein [Methylomonas sp. WSC-6]MCQ8128113.1 hypothetical protein [Methylomonas sp. WSC-6]